MIRFPDESQQAAKLAAKLCYSGCRHAIYIATRGPLRWGDMLGMRMSRFRAPMRDNSYTPLLGG